MDATELITKTLAILVIVAFIIQALEILLLLTKKIPGLIKKNKIEYKHIVTFTYIISMLATMGSLYYSEVAGYAPCKFCWYQRIMMYPQAILYLVSLISGDKKVHLYALPLAVIGAVMAFYHYLLQIGIIETTSCSTVGFSISCSDRFTTTFGFVTIPMMAFAAFSLISVTWIVYLKSTKLNKIK